MCVCVGCDVCVCGGVRGLSYSAVCGVCVGGTTLTRCVVYVCARLTVFAVNTEGNVIDPVSVVLKGLEMGL